MMRYRLATSSLAATLVAAGLCGCHEAPAAPHRPYVEITQQVFPDAAAVPHDSTDAPVLGPAFGVGAAAADFDNDGRVDLYLAGPGGGQWLVNTTPESADTPSFDRTDLPDTLHGVYVHGAAAGDLDRDGYTDLVLATARGIRLLRNVRGTAMSDLTDGLPTSLARTRVPSVIVADFDNDGLLDIYVAEYGEPVAPAETNGALLLNRGQMRFTDATPDSMGPRHTWTGLAADFDRDSRLDLLVVAETWFPADNPSVLLYNNGIDEAGRLSFMEFDAEGMGLADVLAPMGAAAGDPDGDGALEFLVTAVGPPAYFDVATSGSREFRRVSSPGVGARDRAAGWGAALADFDGDGQTEAFVVRGAACVPEMCEHVGMMPTQYNEMLAYDTVFSYETQRRIVEAMGLAPPEDASEYRNGRGVVMADLAGDARDEIVITPFNDRFRVFQRTPTTGSYLRITLHGSVSAPTPYGAEVHVTHGQRTQWAQLTSGGSTHSHSQPSLLFELGESTVADAVVVRWPSGLVQSFDRVAVDQTLVIREPEFLTVPERIVEQGASIDVAIARVTDSGELVTGDDRSDGIELSTDDGRTFDISPLGDGRFRATLATDDLSGEVRVGLSIDGVAYRTRPVITLRDNRPH